MTREECQKELERSKELSEELNMIVYTISNENFSNNTNYVYERGYNRL